jgi:hypothetical protein
LLIWVRREAEYFCKWGWTGFSTDSPSGKSVGGTFEPALPSRFAPDAACVHRIPFRIRDDFRYSNRVALGVNGGERADIAIKGTAGKRLTYRQPH